MSVVLLLLIPETIMHSDGRRKTREECGVQVTANDVYVGEVGLKFAQVGTLVGDDDLLERRSIANIPCAKTMSSESMFEKQGHTKLGCSSIPTGRLNNEVGVSLAQA